MNKDCCDTAKVSNDESNGEPAADKDAKGQEIEVGIERFQAASGGLLEKIADAVYLAISSVEDVAKRSEVWDNLIVVGNGSKICGMFREQASKTL